MTNLGAHITGHPRRDYDDFASAKPRLVVSVDDGGVLEETKRLSGGHAVTVFRDTTVFLEVPGDINKKDPNVTWDQYCDYWYDDHGNANGGGLKKKFLQNPADFYCITNEKGANNPDSIKNKVIFERGIMQRMNADGLMACILNLAGGSPGDFTLWQELYAPFIIEAWQAGNIYGRHVYGGNLVDEGGHVLSGQPSRPIEEIAWLNAEGYHGGLAITECGLDGGVNFAGIERFTTQMTAYEKELRPYADIIGIAMWNLGPWKTSDANWQDAIPAFVNYMEANETDPWTPGEVEPGSTLEDTIWLASLDAQTIELNAGAALQTTITAKGYVPVGSETRIKYGSNDYVLQPAEALDGRPRRVAWALVPQWGNVQWLAEPGDVDPPPPPPPPPGTVDLLPYMAGVTSGNGPLYEIQTSWGPQERVQTQWTGRRWLITKGNEQKANWEERWSDDEWIYFGTDTSESETRYYTQRSGNTFNDEDYGAVWCPRRMTVGQSAYREPHLTHYSKLDCHPVNSGVVPSYLHFIAGPMRYTFHDSGITLDDVVELGFSFAADGASFVERYLFAKGFGLVGWFSQDGRYSWISEIHQPGQRPDNKPLVIPCLDSG